MKRALLMMIVLLLGSAKLAEAVFFREVLSILAALFCWLPLIKDLSFCAPEPPTASAGPTAAPSLSEQELELRAILEQRQDGTLRLVSAPGNPIRVANPSGRISAELEVRPKPGVALLENYPAVGVFFQNWGADSHYSFEKDAEHSLQMAIELLLFFAYTQLNEDDSFSGRRWRFSSQAETLSYSYSCAALPVEQRQCCVEHAACRAECVAAQTPSNATTTTIATGFLLEQPSSAAPSFSSVPSAGPAVVVEPNATDPTDDDDDVCHEVCNDDAINCIAVVLTASDLFPFDGFGGSVAVSGETIVVGAAWGGKATYVFVKAAGTTDWTQQAKVVPENKAETGQPEELFGFSVAIDEDTVIVGAPSDIGGSVYLFVRTETTSWTEQARFANLGEHWFGNRVAIANNTAVVAEHSRAYVFTRAASAWTMSATLPLGVFPENGDVAVYKNTIAVCNRFCFDSSEACVALYTGSGSDWTEQTVIRQSDYVTSMFFGKSMAMTEDNKLVVGAWYGPYAYVFQRDEIDPTEWTLQSVLEESSGSTGIFGQSVAISGSTIVVAAFQASGAGNEYNYEYSKVHVFEQDSGAASDWTERTTLYSYHGWALAMDGEIVAFASSGGLYSNLTGSVAVFDLSLLQIENSD